MIEVIHDPVFAGKTVRTREHTICGSQAGAVMGPCAEGADIKTSHAPVVHPALAHIGDNAVLHLGTPSPAPDEGAVFEKEKP